MASGFLMYIHKYFEEEKKGMMMAYAHKGIQMEPLQHDYSIA